MSSNLDGLIEKKDHPWIRKHCMILRPFVLSGIIRKVFVKSDDDSSGIFFAEWEKGRRCQFSDDLGIKFENNKIVIATPLVSLG